MWIQILIFVHEKAGHSGGPTITDWNNKVLNSTKIDVWLHCYLIEFYKEGAVFPTEITEVNHILDIFLVYRSLQRASTTRDLNQNILPNDIDIINCWKTVEAT